MKKLLVVLFALSLAASAFAQSELNNGHNVHKFMERGYARPGGGGGSNLVDHGGPVIVAPKVVFIFWGWSAGGDSYTSGIQSFRSNGIYNYSRMLSQYRSAGSGAPTNLQGSQADVFDSSAPPTAVTDADVQNEVIKNFHGNYDTSTIYEVVIPIGHYSSDNGTSCGGPNLAYCAYHGNFSDGADVKYAILPYPNCSGCQTSGFSINQDQDHFIIHETREAISDPDLNAWFDRRGAEADDKCAWSPTPFIDNSTGFAYQYEWSNSAGGCVKQ